MCAAIELARKEKDVLRDARAGEADSSEGEADALWQDDGVRWLYRALRPDEDPEEGLRPRDAAAGATPAQHVAATGATQFVSLTQRPEVALSPPA